MKILQKPTSPLGGGKVDILTGGFPCQPFSLAGKRGGADDDRYLWPEMLRAIREIHPTWIVGENVNGITTMVQPGTTSRVASGGSLFEENHTYRTEQQFAIDEIIESLEREGYSVQPFVIPACAVGAPHRRDRVWIVANADRNRLNGRKEGLPVYGERSGDWQEWGDLRKFAQEHGGKLLTPDSDVNRGDAYGTRGETKREWRGDNGESQEWCKQAERACGFHDVSRIDTNTSSNGLQRRSIEGLHCFTERKEQRELPEKFTDDDRREDRFGTTIPPNPNENIWQNFPTQSPICSRDDGLSDRLVDITFPKWRAESIKALGNAWVPQVAYEIFKAIAEVTRMEQE